jgi:hypothetical protein
MQLSYPWLDVSEHKARNCAVLIPEQEEWIRKRIRMCYWKQWRWPRTKIKSLVTLRVDLDKAIMHTVSSHRYWHMARTPALQQALDNASLNARGLVSIRDPWIKAQGYPAKKKQA